eukprot:5731488-Prymnesium_polylepis.2
MGRAPGWAKQTRCFLKQHQCGGCRAKQRVGALQQPTDGERECGELRAAVQAEPSRRGLAVHLGAEALAAHRYQDTERSEDQPCAHHEVRVQDKEVGRPGGDHRRRSVREVGSRKVVAKCVAVLVHAPILVEAVSEENVAVRPVAHLELAAAARGRVVEGRRERRATFRVVEAGDGSVEGSREGLVCLRHQVANLGQRAASGF